MFGPIFNFWFYIIRFWISYWLATIFGFRPNFLFVVLVLDFEGVVIVLFFFRDGIFDLVAGTFGVGDHRVHLLLGVRLLAAAVFISIAVVIRFPSGFHFFSLRL